MPRRAYKATPYADRRGRAAAARAARRAVDIASARAGYSRAALTSFVAGSETKWFDTTLGNMSPAATGSITNASLNLIPEGTTESERIGRKCMVKSLHIKGVIGMPSSSIPLTERLRVIVYCDKQANGATAAVTDILETTTVDSFRNLANVTRFIVLSDKTTLFNQTAGIGGDSTTDLYSPVIKTIKFNKKMNLDLEFSASTGALTELRSNNIGVLAISDNGLATIAYTARVRFQG